MEASVISLVSVVIALVAASVATWQARFNARTAERSRALPVVSEAYRESRSKEFQDSIRYLTAEIPEHGTEGFASLPDEWRDSAYRVCYLYDYLGVLTIFGIVNEELVISLFGTGAMRVWRAVESYVKMEREYRIKEYPSDVPPGFLVYYEHLVRRIIDLGGKDAAVLIQGRVGLRHLID